MIFAHFHIYAFIVLKNSSLTVQYFCKHFPGQYEKKSKHRWTWDQSGHPFIKDGHQRTKELFIDSVGIGPTYEDAEPWSSVTGDNTKKDTTLD